MDERYALFIGRWQPLHNGHDHIIRQALNAGKKVLIAVRDTPISEANPFDVYDRCTMIHKYYATEYPGMVKVIEIPDIESINIGRKAGYKVDFYHGPKEVEGISATEIRHKLRSGDSSWKEVVPLTVAKYIEDVIMGEEEK